MNIKCFFFNATATTEIYPLSLHDALPISRRARVRDRDRRRRPASGGVARAPSLRPHRNPPDRTHTDVRSEEHTSDSSHVEISYAVFCLKKKKQKYTLDLPATAVNDILNMN